MNTAPICHGVSSPTQPRLCAPALSISAFKVLGIMPTSACPPTTAAALLGIDCSGRMRTLSMVNPYFIASNPTA